MYHSPLPADGTTSFTYQARGGSPDTVEAHASSNVATVTITVLPVNEVPVAAADAYQAATADGTALPDSDYQALSLDLRFEPGQTRKFVRVRILSDRVTEPEGEFRLLLSEPSGAAILDGSGVATILPS